LKRKDDFLRKRSNSADAVPLKKKRTFSPPNAWESGCQIIDFVARRIPDYSDDFAYGCELEPRFLNLPPINTVSRFGQGEK
jgi:hypothetical protein